MSSDYTEGFNIQLDRISFDYLVGVNNVLWDQSDQRLMVKLAMLSVGTTYSQNINTVSAIRSEQLIQILMVLNGMLSPFIAECVVENIC